MFMLFIAFIVPAYVVQINSNVVGEGGNAGESGCLQSKVAAIILGGWGLRWGSDAAEFEVYPVTVWFDASEIGGRGCSCCSSAVQPVLLAAAAAAAASWWVCRLRVINLLSGTTGHQALSVAVWTNLK
jgi:hypothetical protein